MAKKIDEKTLAILSRVTVEGNTIFLTCGQLDRKQYQAVNEVLENMGGKWNRKAKGHVYPEDPTDKLEQVLLTGEITPPKSFGYFPTPPELAKRVVSLADIKAKMMVLEPSAGRGAIAKEAHAAADKVMVDMYELLPDNYEALISLDLKLSGVAKPCDFLTVAPNPVYDRVCMNPPFSVEGDGQADITHVLHAWKFVKPGGRLVSIMSAGVTFRENKKTLAFRELVDRHGYIERNPEGAFKESGTAVNTVTVVLDKAA
jgi:predicted RNA methylase